MTRRLLLLQLLGLGAATAGVALTGVMPSTPVLASASARRRPGELPFQPLRGPIPLPGDGLSAVEQQRTYARVALQDQLLLPEGYSSEVLLQWGDSLGNGRFGFNNDYLVFTPLDGQRALLTVNFETISPRPWVAGYRQAMGHDLPFQELRRLLAERGGSVDALTLAADDPLRRPLLEVATAAMEDLGIGVAEIERHTDQSWRRRSGRYGRRISGLTGLDRAEARLYCSGPAAAVFRLRQRLGHDDGLGDRIIGSFANCAGGQTPWATGGTPRQGGMGFANPDNLAIDRGGNVWMVTDRAVFRQQRIHPVPAPGPGGDPGLQPAGSQWRQLRAAQAGAAWFQLALNCRRNPTATGCRGHSSP